MTAKSLRHVFLTAPALASTAGVKAADLPDLTIQEVRVYHTKEGPLAGVVTRSGIEGNYTLGSRYWHPDWNNEGWFDYAKRLLVGHIADAVEGASGSDRRRDDRCGRRGVEITKIKVVFHGTHRWGASSRRQRMPTSVPKWCPGGSRDRSQRGRPRACKRNDAATKGIGKAGSRHNDKMLTRRDHCDARRLLGLSPTLPPRKVLALATVN